MRVAVVVFYRGALAHYAVLIDNGNRYEAALLKFCGSSHDLPPPKLLFQKDGRHCQGNTEEQDLLDDLYYAVQLKLQQEEISVVAYGMHKPEKE